MNLSAVIHRELVVQSRQPATHWLRVAAALGVLGAFGVASSAGSFAPAARLGARLFDALNLTTYYLLLICVPLLTADCISREKREGTLGLLFLTPLHAGDIVLGKAIIQGWRGLTLLLATVPMLLLPSLLGGVGGVKLVLTLAIQCTVFLVALTAGVVVSSISRRPVRSALGAVALAVVAVLPLNLGMSSFLGARLWLPLLLPEAWIADPWAAGPAMTTGAGWSAAAHRGAGWAARLASGATGGGSPWTLWLVLGLTGAALVTFGGMRQATRQVASFWQEADPSPGKLRGMVETWVRTIGLIALGTQIVLLGVTGLTQRTLPSGDDLVFLRLLFFAPLGLLLPPLVVNALMSGGEGRSTRRPPRSASAIRAWSGVALVLVGSGALALAPGIVEWAKGGPLAFRPAVNSRVFFFLANSTVLAAAGITAAGLAVAWRRQWSTAVAWSVVLAVVLETGLISGMGEWAIGRADSLMTNTTAKQNLEVSKTSTAPLLGLALVTFGDPAYLVEERVYDDVPIALAGPLAAAVLQNSVGLALALLAAAGFALRLAQRRLAAAAPAPGLNEQQALTRDFCTPLVGRRWAERRRRRTLEVNPVRWLDERSWSARLATWGWCLVVVVAEIPVVLDLSRLGLVLWHQVWLLLGLAAGLAFAASSSFQREKETGVLELLLVTPITAEQVVRGRWLALLRQFVPAAAVVVFLALTAARLWSVSYLPWAELTAVTLAVLGFISTPLLGLYWSLRMRSTVLAWLVTLGAAFAVAGVGFGLTALLLRTQLPGLSGTRLRPIDPFAFALFSGVSFSTQVIVARWFWRRLVAGLGNRDLVLP